MLWLQIIHGSSVCIPWMIVWYVRDVRLLLMAVFWNFLIVTQWVILGKCIISPIENNGSRYLALYEYLAGKLGIHPRDFSKGALLVMTVAPCFVMGSRIAAYLENPPLL